MLYLRDTYNSYDCVAIFSVYIFFFVPWMFSNSRNLKELIDMVASNTPVGPVQYNLSYASPSCFCLYTMYMYTALIINMHWHTYLDLTAWAVPQWTSQLLNSSSTKLLEALLPNFYATKMSGFTVPWKLRILTLLTRITINLGRKLRPYLVQISDSNVCACMSILHSLSLFGYNYSVCVHKFCYN